MLNVVDTGSGRAVMLLHGAPSAVADFVPLVAALAGDHRVIVPELPGYGASPMLSGTYSFARVYALIEDMLLAKGIHELAIVGFSLGGHHALALAASSRVRVTAVVSLAGFAMLGPADREAIDGFVAMLGAPGARLDTPDMRAALHDRFLAPLYRTPANTTQVDTWLAATSAEALAIELAAETRTDLRAGLPALAMPVIARVGTLDLAVPAAYSEEIAALCPRAELQRVPGHGHALLLEQPTDTIAAIRAAVA